MSLDNMSSSYFEPMDWVNRTWNHVKQLPLIHGNIELAEFDYPTFVAARLCMTEDDYLILTNRIADSHLVRLSPTKCSYLRQANRIRDAVQQQLSNSDREPLDVRVVADQSKATTEEVRSVLENLCAGYAGAFSLRCEWIDDYLLWIRDVNYYARVVIPGPPPYPGSALLGLYSRISDASDSGAEGFVIRHQLRRDTIWGRSGTLVALKLIPKHHLEKLNGSIESGRERLLREFRVGRSHTSTRLLDTFDIFCVNLPDPIGGSKSPTYGVAMGWIDGKPLKGSEKIPLGERLRVSCELAEA
ncbi:MAG: hypothetical protein WBN92_02275, partial [Terriglobia bacterium]